MFSINKRVLEIEKKLGQTFDDKTRNIVSVVLANFGLDINSDKSIIDECLCLALIDQICPEEQKGAFLEELEFIGPSDTLTDICIYTILKRPLPK